MSNKFDTEGFQKEITDVINKYSDKGNQFSNAEILAAMTSIYVATVQLAVSDKVAAKYLLDRVIEQACS